MAGAWVGTGGFRVPCHLPQGTLQTCPLSSRQVTRWTRERGPFHFGVWEGREAAHPAHLEKVECEIQNVNFSSAHFPVDPASPGQLDSRDPWRPVSR